MTDVKRKIFVHLLLESMLLHQVNTLDNDLLERVRQGESWAYRSWEPAAVAVVLGRGNKATLEVYEERCQHDNVPIIRRRGGGGTVVLAPGVLVVSVVKRVKHRYRFQEYFDQINTYLIEALQRVGLDELSQRGISDICLCDRKILGSSMYRSKEILFYTASLMVSNDIQLLDRYLRHPSKEPDYRQGRPHLDFTTTICRKYPQLNVADIQAEIDRVLLHRIAAIE